MGKFIKAILGSAFLLALAAWFGAVSFAETASAATTVTGTVYAEDSTTLLDQKWLKLHSTGEQPQWHNVWVNQGQFTIDLDNGTYEADEYWDDTKNDYVRLGRTFTVTDGVYNPDPLILKPPAVNVNGTLQVDGSNVAQAWLDIRSTDSNQKKYYVKVTNGSFGLYLPDGTYHVDGFWSSADQQYIGLDRTIIVAGGTQQGGAAAIAVNNKLLGTLQYDDNSIVAGGWINFRNTSSNQWYGARVTDGAFALRLPDGSYQAEGFWDEASQDYTRLTVSFQIVNGQLSSAQTALELTVPAKNVRGMLKLGNGDNVAGAWINFRNITSDPGSQQWYGVHVKDGNFSIALPDGNYEVEGFWDEGSRQYVRLFDTFTVSGGHLSGIASLNLQVPQNNVQGTLIVDGQNVDGVHLNLHTSDRSKGYSFPVDNGAFAFYLPDGSYEVDGYWDESSKDYVRLSGYSVTIANGQSDPAVLSIRYDRNVTGTLSYDGTPVADAWLNLRSFTKDQNAQWYNAHVSNGSFSLSLPDGTYHIEGYWDANFSKQRPFTYEFTVTNKVSNPNPLNIDVPAENVNGTLKDESGLYVKRGSLSLHSIGVNTNQYYNANVENGQFSLYLPDGSYHIDGFWSEKTQDYEQLPPLVFQVTNGVPDQTLNIQAPVKNVTGTLVKQEGGNVPVAKAWLNIHQKVSTNQSSQWYNARVANGAFSLSLPAGTYVVDGFWDDDAREFISLRQEFTVLEGQPATVALIVPKKNVSGTLLSSGQQPVDGVTLNLHSENVNGGQGYGVSVKNGNFSLYLPDGNYKIDGYWDPVSQDQVTLSYTFSVTGGVSNPNPLAVVVQDKNVTGTLKQADGSPVTGTWLNLHSTGTTYTYYNVRVKDGQFALYLPDGSYRIEGYWDEATQDQVQLRYSFTVTGGKSSPDPLSITVPKNNVTGTLKLEDGTSIDGVYLNLHSDNAGKENYGFSIRVKQGQFSLYLEDGNYVVEGYYDSVTQKQVTARLPFKVTNGQSEPNPLTVTVKKENVFGTFKSQDGVPFDQVTLYLHSVSEGASPGIGYSVNVIQGKFSVYLPDGKYEVGGFYNYKTQQNTSLRYTFTVSGGKSVPDPLDIVVMNPNVVGTLTKNGVALDNVYLSLYSHGTQQNPGFGAGFDVKNGQFAVYLPDGDYTIDSYYDQATQKRVIIGYNFKVVNGVSDPNPLTVVAMDSNVFGTLQVEGNTQAPAGNLNVHSNSPDGRISNGYGISVKDGKFDAYLPDGDYQVDGFSPENSQEYVTLLGSFSVQGGKVSPDPLVVAIRTSNVKGTLSRPDGSPVNEGWVYVQIPVSDGRTRGVGVKVVNGHFGVYLPDGSYTITYYNDFGTQRNGQLNLPFVVSNGTADKDLTITTLP